MAKNLKLNIKNAQIAEAINLDSLKSKLGKKKEPAQEQATPPAAHTEAPKKGKKGKVEQPEEVREEQPRMKARSKSAFADPSSPPTAPVVTEEPSPFIEEEAPKEEKSLFLASDIESPEEKSAEELRKSLFGESALEEAKKDSTPTTDIFSKPAAEAPSTTPKSSFARFAEQKKAEKEASEAKPSPSRFPPRSESPFQRRPQDSRPARPGREEHRSQDSRSSSSDDAGRRARSHLANRPELSLPKPRTQVQFEPREPVERLGPTGKHVKDLTPPKQPPRRAPEQTERRGGERTFQNRIDIPAAPREPSDKNSGVKPRVKPKESPFVKETEVDAQKKSGKFKEFRDIKPVKKGDQKSFDARDRHGLRESDDDSSSWRKKRTMKGRRVEQEDTTIRPTSLKIRVPIALKDLASEMKLKAAQLIQKLFLQGVVVTLNDVLEDETTIQLLGHEFGCEITLDTSNEERIRITGKTIKEEILSSPSEELQLRAPVVAFMGHVDHGKTSLIDAIRKSNIASGEAGAITQHIGAFRTHTPVGDIAILDTPGHEAFSAMRARGADVTDIVVLVVAGDEGMKMQTIEALQQAKAANVVIVVAINKCDKPNFNVEQVYRQLSEHELLPEAWGGPTITVNCSATTGEGISTLLEMLALQSEVMELKSNPSERARGTVLESEMHKGMGACATILVQNGTLRLGDCLVLDQHWARVKTMRNEFGKTISEAGPSTPVEITGLSGIPVAGQEFIVVKNEREAREIAEQRAVEAKKTLMGATKKMTMENLMQQAADGAKKVLTVVLRTDVQGSLEAMKVALEKIVSSKVELNIINAQVGEITESDVQLAAVSKALILGFHTKVESHAESLIKQLGVKVRLHDIIYHAVDDIKEHMLNLLDKIAIETEKGKVEVKALFKSSQHGMIAGCMIVDGSVQRNHMVRVKRGDEQLWRGSILSLKRHKDDVKEVSKGMECGILLNGFDALQPGDILESFEVTYITQQL